MSKGSNVKRDRYTIESNVATAPSGRLFARANLLPILLLDLSGDLRLRCP